MMLNNKQAIEKLGTYAFNKRTGNVIQNRVDNVVEFSKNNKRFDIEINNSWSIPNKAKSVKSSMHIGGTTYKYQIWAIVR